uniref:Uncharacterized protein n=1 Tax=Arundo donax TaxID=35708 RepID=A0A0A9BSL9_ARUDO
MLCSVHLCRAFPSYVV